MNAFIPNAESLALQDQIARFAAEKIAPHALEWDRDSVFPEDTLRELAAMGMGAMFCDERYGGSELSRFDGVLIFEALAHGCPTVAAYASIHNLAPWMIDAFGDEEQKQRFIPRLATMEIFGAYGLTEPGSGSDAAALVSRARRDGDSFLLNGVKQFISAAGVAGVYMIMARDEEADDAVSCFIVEADAPGLSFGALERKMGWNAQPTRSVSLEDCRIPAANRLGEPGKGFAYAMKGLDGGRLNIAACSLGGGAEAVDRAGAYMKERHAFGRPLSDRQALRFQLADVAIELEAARSLLWRAAAAADRGDDDAAHLAAMAKKAATEAGFNAADAALQWHGGYGYLVDYGIEKILRDLRVHRILEGSSEVMRLIVARRLLARESH